MVDGETAARVVALLRAAWLNAWLDLDGVRMRRSATADILGALHQTAAVVVVLSPASALSPWVRAEIAYARALGAKIVALRLEPFVLPTWFGASTVVDVWRDPVAAERVLVQRLTRIVTSRAARRRYSDA